MPIPEIKSLEEFIETLDKYTGKKEKINLILKNDKYLKEYLISLGMPEDWINRMAIYELIKSRLSRILVKETPVRIREDEFVFGKDRRVAISDDGKRFYLGNDSYIQESKKYEGHVEYSYIRGAQSLEKRIVNQYGVVDRQVHRYGGKALDEDSDEIFQLVEWVRMPNATQIMYHAVYQNPFSEDHGYRSSRSLEYDYGYPLSLDKNGRTHTKTPIYFINKYPKFKEWFEKRYKDKESVYVEKVFDMQEQNMDSMIEDHRTILQSRLEGYAESRETLTNIYNGLLEIFADSRLGPVARVFVRHRVRALLEEDPYYSGLRMTKEDREYVYERIMTKLDKDAKTTKPLTDTHIKGVKKEITSRVRADEEYQELRETVADRKSLDDDDYEIEDALADIKARSQAIEGFTDGSNAFLDEIDQLEEKRRMVDLQIKILKMACRGVPVVGKKVKQEEQRKSRLELLKKRNDKDKSQER